MSGRTTKEYTVELSNGKSVTAEVLFMGVYDRNYGADADGNRGMGMWMDDGFNFDTPTTDDDGHELSEEEQAEADSLLEAEANDESDLDYEEDEPDYDDYDDYDDVEDL